MIELDQKLCKTDDLEYRYEKTGNATFFAPLQALRESIDLQPRNQYGMSTLSVSLRRTKAEIITSPNFSISL